MDHVHDAVSGEHSVITDDLIRVTIKFTCRTCDGGL